MRLVHYSDQWPVNPVRDCNRKYYDPKRSTDRYLYILYTNLLEGEPDFAKNNSSSLILDLHHG